MDHDQQRDHSEEEWQRQHADWLDQADPDLEALLDEEERIAASARHHEVGGEYEDSDWATRRRALRHNMFGFDGLVEFVQGALIGWSLSSGEIWVTQNYTDTRIIVAAIWSEAHELTQGSEYEK